jgi:predicted  nucleic acid-binding Zn-ribbon protein
MLQRYVTLCEAKAGIGVGRLEGDSCSACRMQLPAESVAALVAGSDVGICTHCHRLIVVRLENEQ